MCTHCTTSADLAFNCAWLSSVHIAYAFNIQFKITMWSLNHLLQYQVFCRNQVVFILQSNSAKPFTDSNKVRLVETDILQDLTRLYGFWIGSLIIVGHSAKLIKGLVLTLKVEIYPIPFSTRSHLLIYWFIRQLQHFAGNFVGSNSGAYLWGGFQGQFFKAAQTADKHASMWFWHPKLWSRV